MTVQVEPPPRVSPRPHIGLADWKLEPQGQQQQEQHQHQHQHRQRHHRQRQRQRQQPTPETPSSRARHVRAKHRRHTERREKRQSSDQPKQNRGTDKDKRGHEPLAHHFREHAHRETPGRRLEAWGRQPQHEIEFVNDSDNKLKKPKYQRRSQQGNNEKDANNKQQTMTAENALFSFPWKWDSGPGEGVPNNKKAGEETLQKVSTGTEDSRKGVPSVVFAIRDDHNGVAASRESPTPSPISEPRITVREQHHKLHHKQRQHRRPQEEVLPEDLRPIAPSPQVPIMVGNREDPIPCSESLIGSVNRRYATNWQGIRKRPPNYRRTLKKQTMHDLTALESVSTYDLEQRYMVNEVQNILESSKRVFGKDQIALPKLDTAPRDHHPTNNYYKDPHPPPPPPPVRPGDNLASSPPARIGGQIVYNLSESSQKRQTKVRASISAHTASISESLEKMRSNLREKQSMLSHAVFDLKAKQKQQEGASFADRMKNSVNVSQRNPDTVPLLKNQNYISDIFSDIASKMTMKNDKQEDTHSPCNKRGPYIPRVSGILNSKKDHDRENPTREIHRAAAAKGLLEPVSAYPTSEESKYRHHSRTKQSIRDEITSIQVEDPCSLASPITEQFSALLSPAAKSNSSLYLPNIRSRRSTPVKAQKLPFRPSVVVSPSANLASGVAKTKYQSPAAGRDPLVSSRKSKFSSHDPREIQATENRGDDLQGVRDSYKLPVNQAPSERQGVSGRSKLLWAQDTREHQRSGVRSRFPSMQEIIDVTSQASSLLFKDIVDLTDQASRDPTMATNTKCPGGDVIDVTSLASSRLSKTTVKNVICVDEDSRGVIRSRRKLAAMPKRRRRRGTRGPPPTRSTGQRRLADNYNCGERQDWNVNCYSYQKSKEQEHPALEEPHRNLAAAVSKENVKSVRSLVESQQQRSRQGNRDQVEREDENNDSENEEEIVFAPSPDANKGLFEGIWDMGITAPEMPREEPKELVDQDLPKNISPIVPPRSLASDHLSSSQVQVSRPSPAPVNTLELKGSLFMSPYSQIKHEILKRSAKDESHGRIQLQPPEERTRPQQLRSPMEASAKGPLARASSPLTRASSRVARTFSAQAQSATSGLSIGRTASPPARRDNSRISIGRNPTPRTRSAASGVVPPVPQATSSSPMAAKRSIRGRDPSVLPWTRRPQFPSLRRRDAPITAVNQREPEGTVSVAPILADDMFSDDQEETEESEVPVRTEVLKPKIVRPTPVRRASAMAKKGHSSERSTETRSVTFQEGNIYLGPKDEKIPHFICTDHQTVNTDISWKRNKGVRRNIHPWDKDSQCSSREAFHDLSTRDVEPKRDSDKKRRSVEALEKSRTRRQENRKGSKSSSVKRSMYDEVIGATAPQQEVIILDDTASQRYEVFPADSPIRHHHRKKQLWGDVSDLNKSNRSHGKNWETLGESSVRIMPRSNTDTISSPSKSRSRRSAKRDAERRELERREQAMFFDFLCF